MPKINNQGKTSALPSLSTDRGDTRTGVLVRINNYQAWLSIPEMEQHLSQGQAALAEAKARA